MSAEDFDTEFGAVRPPERVDDWEKGQMPVSRSIFDETIAEALETLQRAVQSPLLRPGAQAQSWIWAIAEDGTIYIAVEEIAPSVDLADKGWLGGYPRRKGLRHPVEAQKLGHPTLLDGGAARIAGELSFDEFDGALAWVLNANSGRYCRSAPPSKAQIDNVADRLRRKGLTVRVDYFDAQDAM